MKKKIGIIGLGSFGKNYVETIKNKFQDQIDLVIACRKINERPDFLPSSCQLTNNWIDIIAEGSKKNIDGVIAAIDPKMHYTISELALQFSVPVLVEKPACINKMQAKKLQTLSIEYETPILVNYIHLFSEAFQLMTSNINLNEEKIIEINSDNYNDGTIRSFSALYDFLPHELAMGISLMKKVPKVEYCEERVSSEKPGSMYYIILDYNGIKHKINIGNQAKNKKQSFEITTNQGRYLYENNTYIYYDRLMTTEPYQCAPPLSNTIQTFLNLIDGKQDIRADFKMTIEITKILEEISSKLQNNGISIV